MVKLASAWASFEQDARVGDSYSLQFRQENFSFTAYTCTAILTDSKGVTIETLTVTKSGTGDDTLTVSATAAQMSKPAGVYYWTLRIAQGATLTTIASCRLTLKGLPLW